MKNEVTKVKLGSTMPERIGSTPLVQLERGAAG